MPHTPPRPTPVRSAADLNRLIRALWQHGQLPDDRRPEYEALVVEWAEAHKAERGDVVKAA
jgi:hypothetical protein